MFIIYVAMAYGFIFGVIKYWIIPMVNYFKDKKESSVKIIEYNSFNEFEEINRAEHIENYDRQIDGYTQLIKTLDICIKEESDLKKKAVLLSKQLATLEKLNRTIEKREKLE